jgi:hypothetical protein
MEQGNKRFGQMKLIKNRILDMQASPMFEEEVHHGEFVMRVPNWNLPIEVIFTYYDGSKSNCIVHDKHELEVLNLYHRRNQEVWANDTEYD